MTNDGLFSSWKVGVGLATAILALFLIYSFLAGPSSLTMTRKQQQTVQPLKITSDTWTRITTDEKVESVIFNPMRNDIAWLVVINKDFEHPIRRGPNTSSVDYGDGITDIDLSLPDSGPRSADFILKRIPK